MVAEQAADTERPDRRRLPQRSRRAAARDPGHRPDRTADRKGHGGKLERRRAPRGDREQRQERPDQDGGKADERGALHGGHGALRGTQVKYCGAADIGDFRRRSAGSMTSPASTEATT